MSTPLPSSGPAPDQLRDRVVAAIGDLYEVEAELGRGGMAVVYRARDVRLRRRVAIKVLPPDFGFRGDVRRRFQREAETAAQLSHPNIVPIYAVDERDGLVYLVMACVEGESLAQRLAREPRPPLPVVRRILTDVADALAFAHARGVVHRDVKPDNILVDRESGRPLITDFGIARAAEEGARLTMSGIAIGTPAYMSPEQALGEREIDGRSDVYSLGIVGYEMLAGAPPFQASNTPAMLMKHLGERPAPLAPLRADAPASLVAAVERALAKRPEDRPDAATLRDALRSDSVAALGPPPRTAAPPASMPWEHRAADRGEIAPPVHVPPASSSPPPPPRPAPPQLVLPPTPRPGASRDEWRHWKDEAKRTARWQREEFRAARRYARTEQRPERTVDERIRRFRSRAVGYGSTVSILAAINAATSPHFAWFIFPALGMGIPLLGQLGNLWADRVPLSRIFGRALPDESGTASAPSRATADALAKLAPRDVLEGPHGDAIRRAADDRAAILDTVAKLSKEDRALIPDVAPTATALVERVARLAETVHRLDASLPAETVAGLEARIAAAEREPETVPDRERRLGLLRRQRATLHDLTQRRAMLAGQMESAALALQSLRLDLARLRSAGIQSVLGDVTNATQEARALSREIGHALGAVEEAKKL